MTVRWKPKKHFRKWKNMMIDLYRLLPEEWFEQVGDFSNDPDDNSPSNCDYEQVTYALYYGNSFFGGESVTLYADVKEKVYYIQIGTRQPIGDYAWETLWAWYKSDPSKYEEIKEIIEKALAEREGKE